jgi:hypothetical protein
VIASHSEGPTDGEAEGRDGLEEVDPLRIHLEIPQLRQYLRIPDAGAYRISQTLVVD